MAIKKAYEDELGALLEISTLYECQTCTKLVLVNDRCDC